MKGSC
jgi:hypothetical protein